MGAVVAAALPFVAVGCLTWHSPLLTCRVERHGGFRPEISPWRYIRVAVCGDELSGKNLARELLES